MYIKAIGSVLLTIGVFLMAFFVDLLKDHNAWGLNVPTTVLMFISVFFIILGFVYLRISTTYKPSTDFT